MTDNESTSRVGGKAIESVSPIADVPSRHSDSSDVKSLKHLVSFVKAKLPGAQWEEQTEHALKLLDEDRRLRRLLSPEMERVAVHHAIRMHGHGTRTPPNPQTREPNSPGDMGPALAGALRELLDRWELSGGLLLGDANHEELLSEAARYRGLERSNRRRAVFVELVAAKVPNDGKTRVRDKLSSDQVERLFKKAEASE